MREVAGRNWAQENWATRISNTTSGSIDEAVLTGATAITDTMWEARCGGNGKIKFDVSISWRGIGYPHGNKNSTRSSHDGRTTGRLLARTSARMEFDDSFGAQEFWRGSHVRTEGQTSSDQSTDGCLGTLWRN